MKRFLRDGINFFFMPLELYYLKKILIKQMPENVLLKEIKNLDENILVVAPHSDDEALGTGGIIKGMCDKTNFFVFIPTLNKSREGNKRLFESETAFANQKVKIISGGFEDGNLLGSLDDLRKTVKEIIVGKKIKTIFAPLPTELHSDHYACSSLVLEFIKEEIIDEIFFFSTNHLYLPEMTNYYYAFPGGKNAKIKLLKKYESQQKINFRKVVEIEDVYSKLFGCEKFSEIFCKIEKEEKEKINNLLFSLRSLFLTIKGHFTGSVSRIMGILRFSRNNISLIKRHFK